MDLDDLARLGPYARCAPAIRERAEVDGLWPLVVDGSIQALSSDHSPYIHYEKDAGHEDIFRATLGLNIIQCMLPGVADEGFHRRGLSLTAFARLTASEPARILGLYPRKGSIQVGADADLALWDLDREWEVRREDLLSRHPWTPLEGRRLRGRPVGDHAARHICLSGRRRRPRARQRDFSAAGVRPNRTGRGLSHTERR